MNSDSFDSPEGRTHSMHLRATESSPEMAGGRTLRFIASDETPDRVGDIIEVSGWNLSSYKKNPVVLWGHDTSTVPPIGKAVNVRRGRKPNGEPALYANIEFAPEEAHPFAETVYQLAKRGYLNAVSVGFLPRKTKELSDKEKSALGMPPYGQMYSEADLLEISVVSVPANPSALVSQARGLVNDNVVGKKQVDMFLEHLERQQVTEKPEDGDLSSRLKSKIRGFIDLGATEKSPACRQDGETKEECVERKIPELVDEGMEQDQAVAVADSVCDTACEDKAQGEEEVVQATVPPDVAEMKHIARVEETEETYVITYLKPGVMELAYQDEDDDEEEMGYGDDDKPKRKPKKSLDIEDDYTLGALVAAQAEQARAMTTLTDTISDLTKRLDMAVGGARAGATAPAAPAPEPTPAMSEAEVEDIVRRATTDLLTRFQKKERN